MSSIHSPADSSQHFHLEGQFLGFMPGKKSPFRYLQVMTPDGIIPIKLRKSLQLMLFRYLVAGDWVQVVGQQKWDDEQDAMRLKADEVVRIPAPSGVLGPNQESSVELEPSHPDGIQLSPDPVPKARKAKAAKILICQKSSCQKRGGRAIANMVERSLQDMGLSDQVTVKHTGCMDRCKAGPNIVFMPDKAKYSQVKPKMIPDLVQQHCAVPNPEQVALK